MSDDDVRQPPESDRSFFDCQCRLAQTFHDRGLHFAYAHPKNIDRALEELERAIRLRESIFGKYHNDTGLSYFRKADLLLDKKLYTEALVVARRELRITHRLRAGYSSETPVPETGSQQWWLLERVQWIQDVIVKHQPEIAYVAVQKYSSDLLRAMEFERLGDLHVVRGDFDLALNEYDSALGIEASAEAHNPVEVADLHVKIGDCFSEMKDFEAALQEYDNAERIYLDIWGPTFLVMGKLYQSKGSIFLKQEKFDDALRNYARAYTAFDQTLGKDHELSIEILQDLRIVTVKEMEELRNIERLRKKHTKKSSVGSSRSSVASSIEESLEESLNE